MRGAHMAERPGRIGHWIDMAFLLAVLPPAGLLIARKPLLQYLEFPPLTRYVDHADFSWPVFLALALLIPAIVVPFVVRILRSQPQAANRNPPFTTRNSQFPWWAWLGLALTAIAWALAWTRYDWFEPFQKFTFTPLWIGYIFTVNGLTFRRTGHCLLRDRPGRLFLLFGLSAVFWWYFEYLNRFVQNWHYLGIGRLSPFQYFMFATLPFSTVFPAVLSTSELLASYPRLSAGLDDFVRIRVHRTGAISCMVLILFSIGLALIGIWPDYLFPLLWVSPLFVITAMQSARGEKTVFSGIADGDWRSVCLPALAALICGFFWEMWNYRSLARWIYAVPFVGRYKVFEMPILGYAGYLPFGLECAVVANEFLGPRGASKPAVPGAAKRQSAVLFCRRGNAVILCLIALYFFIVPGILVIRNLADPNLSGPGIPRVAWQLHRNLTPRYARWARARVASGKAGNLELHDVPSTEWPMFGSVYYLWATESLQAAWEQDRSLAPTAPREYARDTIEAAVDLILDPVHHTWVRTHWGTNYMHRENVFFRSLIIAGLTGYERLVGDGKHTDLLRDQVDTLSAELDASAHGILEDYPGECYPIDVFAAIACIKRADSVLGTNHGDFIKRSIRGFEGDMLDSRGLIPYLADSRTGRLLGPSRGTGNSYTLIFAPELRPDLARDWYDRYERHFWQDRWWAAGFREYPREIEPEFADYIDGRTIYDVDAGPIIAGFSPAANAFGLAASRINGRLDHAYTLATQVISATWPLPDGSLLGPRILSSSRHAPYLGEACLLFFLAGQPHDTAPLVSGGRMPGCVYIGLAFYFGLGALIIFAAVRSIAASRRTSRLEVVAPCPMFQCVCWTALLAAAIVLYCFGRPGYAMLAVLFAQFIPRGNIKSDGSAPDTR